MYDYTELVLYAQHMYLRLMCVCVFILYVHVCRYCTSIVHAFYGQPEVAPILFSFQLGLELERNGFAELNVILNVKRHPSN